jgi:hypothetical protein
MRHILYEDGEIFKSSSGEIEARSILYNYGIADRAPIPVYKRKIADLGAKIA